MSQTNSFAPFEARMRGAGMGDAPIRAFRHACEILVSGQTGLLPETAIEPVTELPRYEDISARSDAALLGRAVVVKLNGGLGTGMGLEKAKSLLEVKDGLTFLDFIARQTLWLGGRHDAAPRFLVMNSFSTSRDTLEYLAKYPELGDPARLEL